MSDEFEPAPKELLAQVRRYVRYLTRFFRLDQWDIEVDGELSASEGLAAEVVYVSQVRSAVVHLGEGFPLLNRKDQTDTLIHEFLHIVLAPLDMPFNAALAALKDVDESSLVNTPAARMLAIQYHDANEHVADYLAHCLTPVLKPLTLRN